MLTTEIRDKFIAAIKEGTAELARKENGTYQIQEVLNEFNRVLGLTIIVQNGYLYAGGAELFAFQVTNKTFPIYTNACLLNPVVHNEQELVNVLCEALKTPSIVKLIREQQNEK